MTSRESRICRGLFSVKCALPPNACILLVDDIYTTGSTVDEAARCLQAAGECKVYVAAVAIGDKKLFLHGDLCYTRHKVYQM